MAQWQTKYPPNIITAMERVCNAAVRTRQRDRTDDLAFALRLLDVAKAVPVSCCTGTFDYGETRCSLKAYLNGTLSGYGCGEPCRWIMEKGGEGFPEWP